MGKIDKIIGKFFDNLKKGRVNSFTRDILKNPEARDAVKDLHKAREELSDFIKRAYGESKK